MKQIIIFFMAVIMTACCSADMEISRLDSLKSRLWNIVDDAPGTVGIAFVGGNDTVTINNGVRYALMSVYKLHEALAVAHALETEGDSFDRVLHLCTDSLSRDTWSPMLKEVATGRFDITVGRLVNYAIVDSDNNASNILFDSIISPKDADAFVRSIAPDKNFAIAYSEADMSADHSLSYRNYSSPLACALLMKKVFTEPIVNEVHTSVITDALTAVTTGGDRIGAPLDGIDGVRFGHKTGSGYRNENGELMAFNDVAYITLPSGRNYALAVMIRDFNGPESEAAAIMAAISRAVYDYLNEE